MLRRFLALLLSFTLLAQTQTSLAGTSTVDIMVNTAKALPSCLDYRIKGVCFWLRCAFLVACSVKTSIRIEHFVPEVIVSTYHDPSQHPWSDYGSIVTGSVTGFGSAIVGSRIDSAGTRSRDDRTVRNQLFKDADAIGNPLGMLTFVLSGDWPDSSSPTLVTVPTASEMLRFPSTIGSIMNEWSNVPGTVSSTVVANAKGMADVSNMFNKVTSGINAIPGKLSSAVSGGQSLSNVMSNGLNLPTSSTSGSTPSMPALSSLLGGMPLSMGFFCPPAAQPFGLYFESHLDAMTWRGLLPAEQLYAGSWIPGMHEIGSFPANSWGNLYPRDGTVTQQHPVKGSAILAQRIADIITRQAQPHIYTALVTPSNDYRYFHQAEVRENDPANSKWQRLYPNAESSCQAFGQNDSLSPTSWGDGNTTSEQSYMWNLWRRVECCQKAGQTYLFSVP